MVRQGGPAPRIDGGGCRGRSAEHAAGGPEGRASLRATLADPARDCESERTGQWSSGGVPGQRPGARARGGGLSRRATIGYPPPNHFRVHRRPGGGGAEPTPTPSGVHGTALPGSGPRTRACSRASDLARRQVSRLRQPGRRHQRRRPTDGNPRTPRPQWFEAGIPRPRHLALQLGPTSATPSTTCQAGAAKKDGTVRTISRQGTAERRRRTQAVSPPLTAPGPGAGCRARGRPGPGGASRARRAGG